MLFKNKKLKADDVKSENVVTKSNKFRVSKASAKLFEAHTGSIVNKEKIKTKKSSSGIKPLQIDELNDYYKNISHKDKTISMTNNLQFEPSKLNLKSHLQDSMSVVNFDKNMLHTDESLQYILMW